MHFDNSCIWFPILMWFWVEEVLKLTNLTNGMNNQNHARVMKIWPKTKKMNLTSYERILILDHEETSLIRFWDVFHEIQLKISFYNPWWKSLSHGVWWKKKFEVWWKNSLCLRKKWYVFSFHTWKSFSHFTNFNGMKNLENLD